jgi:DNA-3-methyladenine glycosylase I
MKNKRRCPWVNLNNSIYVKYHDSEWGRPVHDDLRHFEMITLEGAQAGLSWETILKKRENYRKAFAKFNPQKVAKFTPAKVRELMNDKGIVRNRLKIESTITNARAFLAVQKEFGSFDKYIWSFVKGKPIKNKFKTMKDFPAKTELSDLISKDLKKRGFRFVGSTIIYAYMQAIGITNDHTVDCFRK